jgi:hypothetical protein
VTELTKFLMPRERKQINGQCNQAQSLSPFNGTLFYTVGC